MIGEPFIVCDSLVKIHQTADLEVVALQGLDLIVARGEMLGVVGPSGSGKSTLLNVLGGLDRPSAGRVWADGQDLLKMSSAALNRYRRSKVGFVWQQSSRNLVPYLTAVENVRLPMTLAGRSDRANRRRAEELLRSVGLADRRHHRLSEMSGGEQQRVSIAVALANDPVLLLADEPTGEVDTSTAFGIYETLRKLNRERGLTMLIVSHDPGLARHVDRVVAVRDGKTSAERRLQLSHDVTELTGLPESTDELQTDDVLQELVVLDSAGRLQIPAEYLEHFDIGARARLELAEEGILILPVPSTGQVQLGDMSIADLLPGPGPRDGSQSSIFLRLRDAGARLANWTRSRPRVAPRLRKTAGGRGDESGKSERQR
jgi:ABC-type lipoprotein export system ATPase subunit